uniref:Secreted protein n=1 Tax=Opuntia streptacantha TaxID=393608 RepID=A0A7C9AP37_OPUST
MTESSSSWTSFITLGCLMSAASTHTTVIKDVPTPPTNKSSMMALTLSRSKEDKNSLLGFIIRARAAPKMSLCCLKSFSLRWSSKMFSNISSALLLRSFIF